jgi:hypothetical protein
MQMPSMPKFEDKMQEREYLKGRLAAAFRIFGKNGYDEGMDDAFPCKRRSGDAHGLLQ